MSLLKQLRKSTSFISSRALTYSGYRFSPPSFVNQDHSYVQDHDPGINSSDAHPSILYEGHKPLTSFQRALLTVGSGITCLVRPQRDDMIAIFGETSGHQALQRLHNLMLTDETGARILRDQPRIRTTTVNLQQLRALPPDTLGRVYTDFLDRYNYTPDARRPVHYVDDPNLAYVMTRYREIHDLVHAILRQPTDMLGEVVVKWIEAAQTRLPMCVTAAWFGPLRLRPKQRQRYLSIYLPYALRVSRDANLFMNYYFEENWEKPLSEVWRELNIEPPPVESKSASTSSTQTLPRGGSIHTL